MKRSLYCAFQNGPSINRILEINNNIPNYNISPRLTLHLLSARWCSFAAWCFVFELRKVSRLLTKMLVMVQVRQVGAKMISCNMLCLIVCVPKWYVTPFYEIELPRHSRLGLVRCLVFLLDSEISFIMIRDNVWAKMICHIRFLSHLNKMYQ